MTIPVYTTDFADLQIGRLRNRDREAFDRFVSDLGHRGCIAPGYRLTGPEPVNAICVKHLVGPLRAIVGFKTSSEAWIVLVGPHARDRPEIDVYTLLYELAGVRPPDDEKRTKPPCCDAGTGLPVELGDLVEQLVARARGLARGRR